MYRYIMLRSFLYAQGEAGGGPLGTEAFGPRHVGDGGIWTVGLSPTARPAKRSDRDRPTVQTPPSPTDRARSGPVGTDLRSERLRPRRTKNLPID